MIKPITFIAIAAMLINIIACSKNNNNSYTNPAIVGTWKFVALNVSLANTGNYTESYTGTAVRFNNTATYETLKTSGTVTITPNNMSVEKLAFVANSNNYFVTFKNGKITDSATFQNEIHSSVMTKSTNYRFVSTDSIYTNSTGLANLDNFINQDATSGGGITYAFIGDTLVFTSPFHQEYVDKSFGENVKTINTANSKMFFIKQ